MKRKIDYKEQLKSPKWQKKRLEIMQRDNFTCQICGETEKQLHVHHLAYFPNHNIWDYSAKHLITVCEECHEFEHSKSEVYNLPILLHDIGCCGITTYEATKLLEELIGDDSIMLKLIETYEKEYENNEVCNNLKRLYNRRRQFEEEIDLMLNSYVKD